MLMNWQKQNSHQNCIDKLYDHYWNKFNSSDVMNEYHVDFDDCLKKNGILEDYEHYPFKECTGLQWINDTI